MYLKMKHQDPGLEKNTFLLAIPTVLPDKVSKVTSDSVEMLLITYVYLRSKVNTLGEKRMV